jgi:ubiquinone/menaquinone biosynthesis C-methylase UbiE
MYGPAVRTGAKKGCENEKLKEEIILAGLLRKIRTFLPQEICGPIATLYEKVATPALRQFHQQVALEITSSLSSGRVLDVGTGPGHLLIEIGRCNPNLELVGIDLSRKMLKIAKQSLERNGMRCAEDLAEPVAATANTNTGIRLVRADVGELPFSDNAFDLVVSTLSIHHWRDPSDGIRECFRVTAPGGRCWIYDLRTDVPVGALAKSFAGEGLGHLALSWIFKFHGVDPKQYQAPMVASWLGGGVTVQSQVHAAYLKLNIQKALCESQDRTRYSKSLSSTSCGEELV